MSDTDDPNDMDDDVTDEPEPTDEVAESAESNKQAKAGKGGRSAKAEPGEGEPAELKLAKRSLASRLYHGETTFNIVGRRRLWFAISGIAVLLGIGSLLTRGLHLGIDFEGGVVWEIPAGQASEGDVLDVLEPLGRGDATVQTLTSERDGSELIRVETEPMDETESAEVTQALVEVTGSSSEEVNFNSVGPSWGEEISEKAIRALVVFLVLVTLYIAVRFELRMAIPTLVALIHDVLITVGVYSLTQFEVTPATVIAMLTILGYSIYDGIVVFDKVDENNKLVSSTGGMSYGGMVNLSLNQVLMRSLNTSITALLPVASLLIVGSWVMGASTLEEFALALLIGLFSGAYSSIFIASPLLALLKEREPRFRDIRRRIEAKGGDLTGVGAVATKTRPPSRAAAATAAPSDAPVDAMADSGNGGETARPATTTGPGGRIIPARPRKKTKGRRH